MQLPETPFPPHPLSERIFLMTSQTFLPCDVLLHIAAKDAGRAEIDEYLRCSGKVPEKRCFKRILKRIRRSELYRNGKLTAKAKTVAVMLLVLLAASFAVMGFCAARLVRDASETRNFREYFSLKDDDFENRAPTLAITEFLLPKLCEEHTVTVLVQSSSLYNVEYKTSDGYIYYTQSPKEIQREETAENKALSSDGLYVLVNDNPGEVLITHTDNGKIFELRWADKEHNYSIYGTKSMEEAVMLAKSVYQNITDSPKAQ